MRKTVLLLTILSLFAFAPISMDDAKAINCSGCEAAENARNRTAGPGRPGRQKLVCFRVLMSDPHDSVSVTVTRNGVEGKLITFPRKAAARFSGLRRVAKGRLPSICLKPSQVRGGDPIIIIPGSKDGCGYLYAEHVQTLLKKGNIPENNPVCLLKEKECDALKAQGW